jgi:hypothetical protein
MAEEEKLAARGEEGGEEEIIEKKPSAPTATVLMILTTIFLGLGIYIAGDEIGSYFNPKDYEKDHRAVYHYTQFSRKDARPELAKEVQPGGAATGAGAEEK